MGPVKDPERIKRKAKDKHDGELDDVSDICRCTIYFDDVSDIIKLRKIFIAGRFTHPFNRDHDDIKITLVDDCFKKPKYHGYVGFHVNLSIPTRKNPNLCVNCEVQFHHRGMRDVYKETHDQYKIIRQITDVINAPDCTANEAEKRTYTQCIDGLVGETRKKFFASMISCGVDTLVEDPEWQKRISDYKTSVARAEEHNVTGVSGKTPENSLCIA